MHQLFTYKNKVKSFRKIKRALEFSKMHQVSKETRTADMPRTATTIKIMFDMEMYVHAE